MIVAEDASKKRYSHLDKLSTEELQTILRASALSEESDDSEMIDYILEVIMLREKDQYNIPDVEQARKEFDQFYRDLESPLYPVTDIEAEEANFSETALNVPKCPKRRVEYILIAAVLIAALVAMTCVPVFGYTNVVQMIIAYWTDDYFSFASGSRELGQDQGDMPFIVQKGFEDLWYAAEKNGIQNLAIPQYIPNGFQVEDTSLDEYPLTGGFEFYIFYTKDADYIGISITNNDESTGVIYEKDTSEVNPYELNGVEYFIFNNNGENVSTISWNGIEYVFWSTLSKDELKQIIDSMNKE